MPTPILPVAGPTVILVDDGKGASVARVPGGGGLTPARLRAELRWGGDDSNRLAADLVTIDDVGVRATFPSLQKLRLAADGKTPHRWRVVLTHPVASTDAEAVERILEGRDPLTGERERTPLSPREKAAKANRFCGGAALFELQPDERTGLCRREYEPVLYVPGDPRPKASATVERSIAANRVVAVVGQGSLTVGIKLDPGVPARSAYVQIAGAEIESANGGELDELGRLKLAASGRVTLTLRNAAPGGKISVTVGLLNADGKTEGTPLTSELDVVEGQPKVQAGIGAGRPAT